jgi:hypothetical protein
MKVLIKLVFGWNAIFKVIVKKIVMEELRVDEISKISEGNRDLRGW